LVDQPVKVPTLSAMAGPKTPPLPTTKGPALSDRPSSPFATPGPTAASVLPLDLTGFSLGGAPKPDAKSTAEDATKPATTAAPSPFAGIKSGTFSLLPRPEPSAEALTTPDSKPKAGSLFGTKPPAVLGATPQPPLALGTASPFGNLSGAIAPAMSMSRISVTTSRTHGDTSLITPPKESASKEPLHPMQIEFTNLYTEVGRELAKVRRPPSFALWLLPFVAHVALPRLVDCVRS
jgi:hypothetical protein